MLRRRKVGSSLVLSALSALAVVGMGLAAAVTPASTSTEFGFEFNPKPEEDTPIGTVTAPSMDNIKLVVDEAQKTVTLKNPIVFTFVPDDSLVDHTFEMTYTFTMPEDFDTYFTLSTELTGTVQADSQSSLSAEDAITFTISLPTSSPVL